MNKIEKYLTNVDKRQKYLIYFMIFGLIIYVFIQAAIPLKQDIDTLQSRVDELQVKLSSNSLSRLKRQKELKRKEFLLLKSKEQKQKEDMDYLISKLYKLKYAFYDKKEWAKSIDDIMKYSLKRDIKIEYLKNLDTKHNINKNLLKQKGSLEISGSGNYIDIVAFISYIDNLNTLLQFETMDIKIVGKELKFKLLIDMYGIGL
jgi:Tfp pilus assembly protein PilO